MKQSGFVLPSPTMLLAGALAAACLVIAVQTWRLDSLQEEHANFVAEVKAKGEAQEAKTKETVEKHNKLVKEKNDENATLHAQLDVAAKRLRDKNSSRSLVPPAPDTSRSPDRACFDRTELNGALREFTRGLDELIIACESRTIDLNTAKTWAQSIKE